MKTDNSFLEGLEEFKYLGTVLTNHISIQEEIKCRLQSGEKSIVFQFATSKYKDYDIQNCNFVCLFCMGVKPGGSH